jgi:hypothetical protein
MYEIRIKGRLSKRWDTWFDHMTARPAANGETTLTGPVIDQAALHGLLEKILALGLQLISVSRIESLEPAAGSEVAGNTNHPPLPDLGTGGVA